jgi:hypothetical protein
MTHDYRWTLLFALVLTLSVHAVRADDKKPEPPKQPIPSVKNRADLRRLIDNSEALRQIEYEWEYIWFNDEPSQTAKQDKCCAKGEKDNCCKECCKDECCTSCGDKCCQAGKKCCIFQTVSKIDNREIERRLNTLSCSLDYKETPLADILESLHQSTGLNIVIDGPAIPQARTITEVPFHVEHLPLKTALTLLLRQRELTYVVQDGVVLVVPENQGLPHPPSVVAVPVPPPSFMFGVGVNSDAGLVGGIALNERNFDITNWPTGEMAPTGLPVPPPAPTPPVGMALPPGFPCCPPDEVSPASGPEMLPAPREERSYILQAKIVETLPDGQVRACSLPPAKFTDDTEAKIDHLFVCNGKVVGPKDGTQSKLAKRLGNVQATIEGWKGGAVHLECKLTRKAEGPKPAFCCQVLHLALLPGQEGSVIADAAPGKPTSRLIFSVVPDPERPPARMPPPPPLVPAGVSLPPLPPAPIFPGAMPAFAAAAMSMPPFVLAKEQAILHATADHAMRAGESGRIVLEGHVRIKCEKNGSHEEMTADSAVIDLPGGQLQIKLAR